MRPGGAGVDGDTATAAKMSALDLKDVVDRERGLGHVDGTPASC